MLKRTPTAAEDSNMLVPPALMKGSDMPLVGSMPVTTPSTPRPL